MRLHFGDAVSERHVRFADRRTPETIQPPLAASLPRAVFPVRAVVLPNHLFSLPHGIRESSLIPFSWRPSSELICPKLPERFLRGVQWLVWSGFRVWNGEPDIELAVAVEKEKMLRLLMEVVDQEEVAS